MNSVSFYSFEFVVDTRAVELHAKMRKNLKMTRERVAVLRSSRSSFSN